VGPAVAVAVAVIVMVIGDVLESCYYNMRRDSRRRRKRTGCSSSCPGRTADRPTTTPGVYLAPEQGSVLAMVPFLYNYLCASFFPCLFSVKNTLNDCVEVVEMIV